MPQFGTTLKSHPSFRTPTGLAEAPISCYNCIATQLLPLPVPVFLTPLQVLILAPSCTQISISVCFPGRQPVTGTVPVWLTAVPPGRSTGPRHSRSSRNIG